jgi:hypothetical protein
MELYEQMFAHTGSFLTTMEEVQPPPLHVGLSEAWWSAVEKELTSLMEDCDIPAKQIDKTTEVLDCFHIGYTAFAAAATTYKEDDVIKAKIASLLSLPQSVQRTDEWYKEMATTLTASEFYQVFGTPRTRGQLVLSKAQPPRTDMPAPRKACMTAEMSPLDWGIRFEPVAKQILEARWGAEIAELGRLRHPTLPNLAASPDGLITASKDSVRLGHLIEIKCPSSRTIGQGVPSNYWHQMQLQLEVTGCPICEYSEFQFCSESATMTAPNCKGTNEKGLIYLIQNDTTAEMRYIYGPLNEMEWTPITEEGWSRLERIPWVLEKDWIHSVQRDTAWFQSILPRLDEFWADVAKARAGTFILPESLVKKRSMPLCAIKD